MGLGPAAQLVAVGVDDSEEGFDAARYAVGVARDRGWDLIVLHSLQAGPGEGTAAHRARRGRSRVEGDRLVDRLITASRISGEIRVHRIVASAPPVEALREVSGYVSLLVLGQHQVELADQVVTGRVGAAVAAAARCPVAIVPRGWDRTDVSGRPVVVVLDGEPSSTLAARCALDEAALRRTSLVALRAEPGRDRDPDPEQVAPGTALAAGQREHPDVEVRVLVVEGDPRSWSVDASALASLVVVGRPHRGLHVASWSRAVAGTVLAASGCPLLVAPSDDAVDLLSSRDRRSSRARRR